jgi:hypothetical protein
MVDWRHVDLARIQPQRIRVGGIAVEPDHLTLKSGSAGETNVIILRPDFSPNAWARFKWPLQVGKQYEDDYRLRPFNATYANTTGGMNDYHTTWTVEAYEPLTVPAGTFDTFRIKGTQCNLTQGGHPCGDFIVWYAPQVKNWVKISLSPGGTWGTRAGQSEELLSYKIS